MAVDVGSANEDIHLVEFRAGDAEHVAALVELWNAACGADLAISPRFAAYNLEPLKGLHQAGRLALVDGAPIGVVLTSHLPDEPSVMEPHIGWIDALAVRPAAQRQGAGSALLAWAEGWLLQQGATVAVLGTSLHPFTPGLPVELENDAFFSQRGYGADGKAWDVAADLSGYRTPAEVRAIEGEVRPARPQDAGALLEFWQREFPGRWRYEFEAYLAAGHRIGDYMILWSERGIDGACTLTFEDSGRPFERFYPYRLPRPWGQLGSVGVSADRRGRGYGLALLDAGLRRLHDNGVNGCVIDWTGIVDFYAKFGFRPYREYTYYGKLLT